MFSKFRKKSDDKTPSDSDRSTERFDSITAVCPQCTKESEFRGGIHRKKLKDNPDIFNYSEYLAPEAFIIIYACKKCDTVFEVSNVAIYEKIMSDYVTYRLYEIIKKGESQANAAKAHRILEQYAKALGMSPDAFNFFLDIGLQENYLGRYFLISQPTSDQWEKDNKVPTDVVKVAYTCRINGIEMIFRCNVLPEGTDAHGTMANAMASGTDGHGIYMQEPRKEFIHKYCSYLMNMQDPYAILNLRDTLDPSAIISFCRSG